MSGLGDTMEFLPPFLAITDPLEPEQLPLQVALLTMQVALLTTQLRAMQAALQTGGHALMGGPVFPASVHDAGSGV
jgi:hypothetical protein